MKIISIVLFFAMASSAGAHDTEKGAYKLTVHSTGYLEKEKQLNYLKVRLQRHKKLTRDEIIEDLLEEQRGAVKTKLGSSPCADDLEKSEKELKKYENFLNQCKDKETLLALERRRIREVRGAIDFRMGLERSVYDLGENAPGWTQPLFIIGALPFWPLDMVLLPITLPIYFHTKKYEK